MEHRFVKTVAALLLISISCFSKILDTLIIEGLDINKASMIKSSLFVKSGEEFSSIDLQRSIKSLYHLGLFKSVDFYILTETDSAASLVLRVEENPVCESIEYAGLKKLKQKDIEEKIKLKRGMVISESFLHDNIVIIKNLYAEEGFLLAEISTELIKTTVPGNVIAKFTVKEGKKVRIKEIVFSGNEALKDKKIKRKFKTKEKKLFNAGEYKKDQYQRHLDSLIMYYHDQGYLDARVLKDSVWYEKNLRDIHVEIRIEEGKKYYAGDFYFTGNRVIEKADLAGRVAMKRGKPFSKSKYEMTKMFLSNVYREEGYLWVQLQDQFQYRGDTIDVSFSIVEGKPAIVRKIDIAGNEKTREKVIRRELQVYPGQKYKQSRMERSIREVMQLNYFNNVKPDLKPNDDGTIDLVYTVEEKENIGQFSAGVMYSQVERLGGNFNITIPNFRGAGQQLDADIEYSKYRKRYSAGFLEPWIFDTPTSFSIRAFYEEFQAINRQYDYQSVGVEFGGGRRLKWPDDYFRLYMRYRISYEKDNRAFQGNVGNFTVLEDGLLSRLSLILERNDTDIPMFPNKGSVLSIQANLAGLGGDYNFAKGIVAYDWYFPLVWKFVLGMKTKFGLIGGIGNNNKIARSDLFAAGGVYYDGQIRGYGEGAFGRYTNHGLNLLTFSGEVRVPILEQQLYVAAFTDYGNVWDDIADINLSDMYPGVGLGFRLQLPMIGLLGFDFAWGLKDPRDPHFGGKPAGFTPHFLMNRGF